jgi:hypothetical protein
VPKSKDKVFVKFGAGLTIEQNHCDRKISLAGDEEWSVGDR